MAGCCPLVVAIGARPIRRFVSFRHQLAGPNRTSIQARASRSASSQGAYGALPVPGPLIVSVPSKKAALLPIAVDTLRRSK